MINSFKELIVWQKSYNLCLKVYFLTETFPKHEQFNLVSQIRRCSISIPSNIAEGSKRSTKKDYSNFLSIAEGSLAELETQLMLSKDLNFISEKDFKETSSLITEVGKMLHVLILKLC
jgi:four helix bundle protein